MRSRTLATLAIASLTIAFSGHDSDYMPYRMKGMNAYVYDSSDREHFAGFSAVIAGITRIDVKDELNLNLILFSRNKARKNPRCWHRCGLRRLP